VPREAELLSWAPAGAAAVASAAEELEAKTETVKVSTRVGDCVLFELDDRAAAGACGESPISGKVVDITPANVLVDIIGCVGVEDEGDLEDGGVA
jgi:hypothetical protein